MEKWLKKDIRTLCGFLDSFYVVNRPLSNLLTDYDAARAHIREVVEKNRQEIVLAGIREAMQTSAARYRSDCETIGNQLVRFTEYGKPDDLIERFTDMAKAEDAAGKALEKLLHRVIDEGLPDEVRAYDPTKPR